jgi:hypothetical protein
MARNCLPAIPTAGNCLLDSMPFAGRNQNPQGRWRAIQRQLRE